MNRPVLKDTIPLGVSPEADRGEPSPAAQRKPRGRQAAVLLIRATPAGSSSGRRLTASGDSS